MRKFESGATRDDCDQKYDYEGFLCPEVIEKFGAYMHANRVQADGNLRDSDNWQKGIPLDQYQKSLWRHHHEMWKLHRRKKRYGVDAVSPQDMYDAICGVMFNAMGYMHELIKAEED